MSAPPLDPNPDHLKGCPTNCALLASWDFLVLFHSIKSAMEPSSISSGKPSLPTARLWITVLTLVSYILNGRYIGAKTWQLWLVIISNTIWIVFPSIGMYASYDMIMNNTYQMFL